MYTTTIVQNIFKVYVLEYCQEDTINYWVKFNVKAD